MAETLLGERPAEAAPTPFWVDAQHPDAGTFGVVELGCRHQRRRNIRHGAEDLTGVDGNQHHAVLGPGPHIREFGNQFLARGHVGDCGIAAYEQMADGGVLVGEGKPDER